MSEQKSVTSNKLAENFGNEEKMIKDIIFQFIRTDNKDLLKNVWKEKELLLDGIESFMAGKEQEFGDIVNDIFAAGAVHTLAQLSDDMYYEAKRTEMIVSQQDERKDCIVKLLSKGSRSYTDLLKLSGYDKEELNPVLADMISDNVRLLEKICETDNIFFWLNQTGKQYYEEKWGTTNGKD